MDPCEIEPHDAERFDINKWMIHEYPIYDNEDKTKYMLQFIWSLSELRDSNTYTIYLTEENDPSTRDHIDFANVCHYKLTQRDAFVPGRTFNVHFYVERSVLDKLVGKQINLRGVYNAAHIINEALDYGEKMNLRSLHINNITTTSITQNNLNDDDEQSFLCALFDGIKCDT